MIINHKHRFIFMRTKKTASTSIEMALSASCGEEDTITYMNIREEAWKLEHGYKPAQNFLVPLRHWTLSDTLKFVFKARRPGYAMHISAASLKRRVDSSTWKNYFKFCVERNPFDRAISLYHWRTKKEATKPSLPEFVRSLDEQSLSNFHIYSVNGIVEADQIIRYEQLEQGLKDVCAHLGLAPFDLPHAKSEFRSSPAHYRDLMTDEVRLIVERACYREMKLLDYQY